jgi:hypothetical protein
MCLRTRRADPYVQLGGIPLVVVQPVTGSHHTNPGASKWATTRSAVILDIMSSAWFTLVAERKGRRLSYLISRCGSEF